MSERVLFTCVGATDPVRDLRDGAMLHIIRHYLPKKVYIVLSKEMEECHLKDDRYGKAIRKFSRDFQHEIEDEDVRYIPCGIEDVSDFDAFDDLFHETLTQITQENPGAEILMNISSGSPQMKIAIGLLATNVKFSNITVVQVKTPAKKANLSSTTTKKKYDVDVELELNEDNGLDAENRCSVPRLFSLRRNLAKEQVHALIKNYEYHSAKILLTDLTDKDSASVTLTEHLCFRQDLQMEEAKKLVLEKEFGIDLYPIANDKCWRETEFFFVLQNLSKTKKITEFTLRLNPFVIRMQELYLLKKLNFDCEQIKSGNERGVDEISREKLEAVDRGLLKAIEVRYPKGYNFKFPNIPLYNIFIKYKGNKTDETDRYINLFAICEEINLQRNSAAHSLSGMSEADLPKSSEYILQSFRSLLRSCYGKECKEEIFDLYDRVNTLIMDNL